LQPTTPQATAGATGATGAINATSGGISSGSDSLTSLIPVTWRGAVPTTILNQLAPTAPAPDASGVMYYL
jgi:hypothetical protein